MIDLFMYVCAYTCVFNIHGLILKRLGTRDHHTTKKECQKKYIKSSLLVGILFTVYRNGRTVKTIDHESPEVNSLW